MKSIDEFRSSGRLADGRTKIRGTCKACEALQRLHKGVARAEAYIITWAQNATPIHAAFWEGALAYAEVLNAEIVVFPGRYKNPTSQWSEKAEEDDYWDPAVVPYLLPREQTLRRIVTLHGDISIQPTAVRPLSGLEAYAGRTSGIFGHPKLELTPIATADRAAPKLFSTTGACTLPNYVQSKAGKKAERHHTLGAALITFDETDWHIRHLNAQRDGAFYDLDTFVSGTDIREAGPAKALVTGDLHRDQLETLVDTALFGEGGIVEVCAPEIIVYHDTLDFRRRNSHRRHDTAFAYRQHLGQVPSDVASEVAELFEYLESRAPGAIPYVVRSNHDEQLDRWLREIDPRTDPGNMPFWCEMWLEVLAALEAGEDDPNPLELAYRKWNPSGRVRFLRRDEPLEVGGIYLHWHGDKGINGSRGTLQGMTKLGVKTVTGHSHVPMIRDGSYSVGVTGKLDQEYNRGGPSSWAHGQVLIHPNGKRQLIMIQPSGKWR